MNITPNYKFKQKCHFCGNGIAKKDNEAFRRCFYIEKANHYLGVYHSARYHQVTVNVPRCKACNRTDFKIDIICGIITIIVFAISTYIWSGIFAETDHNSARSLENILYGCLISILCTAIVGGAIVFIVRMWLEILWNNDSFCDNYEPIQKLKAIGFEPRNGLPYFKNPNVSGKGPLNFDEFHRVIKDIVESNHCIFNR